MQAVTGHFQLINDDDYDEAEANVRGWTRSVLIKLADGRRYRPLFCTPARLQHDAKAALENGAPCHPCVFAVSIAEITRDEMESAAAYLAEWGYFDHVRPEAE